MDKQLTLSPDQEKLKTLLTDIPKTEIHLHLEGLASVDTIWQLMSEHHIPVNGVKSKADLQGKFQIKSLDEFIALFIDVIQNCFQESKDFDYLIRDARNYLKRNNVVYAEIFFAPTKFLLNGFSFATMVEKLESGAVQLEKEDGIKIRYIIDVSRSYGVENATKNVDLTIANRSDKIIGIGLGGAELHGPARDYGAVFKKAAENNLKIVAHAGEDVGPESIWDTLRLLKVARIGHGISAIKDPKLMDYLRDRRIPLEVCPTSNLFTRKYATTLKDHPIRAFYDHGMDVTVNTDDPTLFGVDLIDEYMKLYISEIFSAEEIFELIKNGIYATFLPKKQQDLIWQSAESRIAKFAV
ncbi:MAG TPA: adenosine deaminase [Spirochaetia bacterium]|nr:adenosine deaminase [Spirochaetia bacterium]